MSSQLINVAIEFETTTSWFDLTCLQLTKDKNKCHIAYTLNPKKKNQPNGRRNSNEAKAVGNRGKKSGFSDSWRYAFRNLHLPGDPISDSDSGCGTQQVQGYENGISKQQIFEVIEKILDSHTSALPCPKAVQSANDLDKSKMPSELINVIIEFESCNSTFDLSVLKLRNDKLKCNILYSLNGPQKYEQKETVRSDFDQHEFVEPLEAIRYRDAIEENPKLHSWRSPANNHRWDQASTSDQLQLTNGYGSEESEEEKTKQNGAEKPWKSDLAAEKTWQNGFTGDKTEQNGFPNDKTSSNATENDSQLICNDSEQNYSNTEEVDNGTEEFYDNVDSNIEADEDVDDQNGDEIPDEPAQQQHVHMLRNDCESTEKLTSDTHSETTRRTYTSDYTTAGATKNSSGYESIPIDEINNRLAGGDNFDSLLDDAGSITDSSNNTEIAPDDVPMQIGGLEEDFCVEGNEESQVDDDNCSTSSDRSSIVDPKESYELDDFVILKMLGKGSFAKVLLASLRGHRKYFALKCIRKDSIGNYQDVEHILSERKVLILGNENPFLTRLFCAFQNSETFCYAMDYHSGGDLLFHLQSVAKGRFDEFRAQFYAAEILCALQFLHTHGIIYRDLKLDNVMLDSYGHVHLCDFGLCKTEIYSQYAKTFCGTPAYTAPEIVRGDGYNESVDFWALGVLLYEMLVGRSPFDGQDSQEIYDAICNRYPQMPRFISREAINCLTWLLKKVPSMRLGMPGCPKGKVRSDAFFNDISWDLLEHRQIEPPFRPLLETRHDTSYFEESITSQDASIELIEDENGLLDQSGPAFLDEKLFADFAYINDNI